MLGIKQQSAYELVRAQFLMAERFSEAKGSESCIHRDELDRFLRKYVLAAKVAEQLGTQSRWLISELAKRSIFPVSGYRLDGCR